MKSNLPTLLLALACTVLASCYPYPEVPPHSQAGQKPGKTPTTTSSAEQQNIQAERERMKAAAENKKKETEEKKTEVTTKPTPPTTPSNTTKPTPPKPTPPTDWPFATPVPGKEGLVFSPYNQKIVDVRGMPSGSLVTDPTYSPDEKKFFRVP
jgi:hypothetical protein